MVSVVSVAVKTSAPAVTDFTVKVTMPEALLTVPETGAIVGVPGPDVLASATVLPETPLPPRQCILILPGSRINLLMYKLHQDPRLSDIIARGWHILKFRHLRQFAARRDLSLAVWNELLDSDPPRWEDATQISILF